VLTADVGAHQRRGSNRFIKVDTRSDLALSKGGGILSDAFGPQVSSSPAPNLPFRFLVGLHQCNILSKNAPPSERQRMTISIRCPKTHLRIQFVGNRKLPHSNPWTWQRIQNLLAPQKKTSDQPTLGAMMQAIYPVLPTTKNSLKALRLTAKRYYKQAQYRMGQSEPKTYAKSLKALVYTVWLKLLSKTCRPNPWGWSKRAYALYIALQTNLSGRRLYFLTITLTGDAAFEQIKAITRSMSNKLLPALGLRRYDVISFHPSKDNAGRLHIHSIVWGGK